MRDVSEILDLWQLAYSILFDTGCRAVNISDSYGRSGSHTSHSDWAMTFRAYATEDEHKVMTACVIYSQAVKDVHGVAIRFIRRVPEDVVDTGVHLLDVL